MSVELTITWDGDAPGLAEHELSVATFNKPLHLLLQGVRRTASALAKTALADAGYGGKGGRFKKEFEALDLRITQIEKNCVTLETRVYRPPVDVNQGVLFDDLVGRAIWRVVDDIDTEAGGRAANASVRRYLESLPRGIRQRYAVKRPGYPTKVVEVGTVKLVELPPAMPASSRVVGSVALVGFEPGKEFVGISVDGHIHRCAASPQLVDRALALRTLEVEALFLTVDVPKLVWIRAADAVVPRRASQERTADMLTTWAELLVRLA